MVMINPDKTDQVYPYKLRRLYWPFIALAEVCRELVGTVAGSFVVEEKRYTIPRFVYHGPSTGVPPIRLGFFALVHGDASAGALGLLHLLNALVADPLPARGFELTLFPLCNPTGYEDDTKHNRAGIDLNRSFWCGCDQPEIKILEEELRTQHFDGLITLHADDTGEGLHGYTQDQVLNDNLLLPALRACLHVLPAHPGAENFSDATDEEIVEESGQGNLGPPPDQHPRPFEIIFETPATAPMTKQVEAIGCALLSVLAECRGFIPQGANH